MSRRSEPAARVSGARDRAILALLEFGMSAETVSRLVGSELVVNRKNGRLLVVLSAGRRCRKIWLLGRDETRILREYLEGEGGFGEARPLFAGRRGGALTARAVRAIRQRYDGRPG